MSTIFERVDRVLPVAARITIGVTLLWFGVVKLLPATPRPEQVTGLAKLLALRGVSIGSALVELILGVCMLSSVAGRALPIVVAWLGALAGITAAFVARVVTPGSCGCLGPLEAHPLSRLVMLTGLVLIATIAGRSTDARSV